MSVGMVLAGVGAFAAMEPATYAAHRWVMHGPGERLHRSHHRSYVTGEPAGFEANDLFPAAFATVVMGTMAVGFNHPGARVLVAIGIGITGYGAAYALVHDVYTHRRLSLFHRPVPSLARLAQAHDLHHRFGGEPYGMLMPIIPVALRRRARSATIPTISPGSTTTESIPTDRLGRGRP